MVDMESLLKDAGEIGRNTLIFTEALGYGIRVLMYPDVKSGLDKLVGSGEMKREEADYRLRIYKTYVFLPWPIGGIYAFLKIKRYYEKRQKSDLH